MAQTPGDDKGEPSLELPSLKLPGLGRRKRRAEPSRPVEDRDAKPTSAGGAEEAETAEMPAHTPTEVRADEPAMPQESPETTPAEREPQPKSEPEPQLAPDPEVEPRRRAVRTRSAPKLPKLPTLPGRVAAALTGVLVGLAGALGTYAAMAGCKAVRGVSSCGGAPGFFILVAILVLMVLLGALLLAAFDVSDPGSTSFLAVGVVTVVVMLVLLDVVFSPWMFLVVPLLGALGYLLSHWVTTRFEDEQGRPDWA